jgi:hypothetical protein
VSAMKFLSSCLVVAAMLLLSSGIGAQQSLVLADSAEASAIPFKLQGSFLIEVEGGIGNLEGLKFILDTGVTRSTVDRRIANRFSTERRQKKVLNFDSFIRVDAVEFPEVHFGPIEVHNVTLMVSDLFKTSELIGNADAIIGLDLLTRSSKLSIFYDTKMVVLKPRFTDARGLYEGERPECITVQAMVQGHPVRLVLDTGMEGILLYEDRIRKQIPGLRLTEVRKNAHMGRLGGKTARLAGLRLDAPQPDEDVFLINGPGKDLLPGIVGYLGTAWLKAKRIEIDFEGKTMRWQ